MECVKWRIIDLGARLTGTGLALEGDLPTGTGLTGVGIEVLPW